MKNLTIKHIAIVILSGTMMCTTTSCERGLSEDAEFATFPKNPDVFIDGFSGGLQYLPFGGSKLDAFKVDTQTKYSGTSSMRFDVPNVNNPGGAFAGAIFPDMAGRDLTGFDALTFWAKATTAATINEIGFGNDFGENKFQTTLTNMRISTEWTKYIIPLPDPSQLVAERGMFWYAEGPENGNGYTFWIDELKFEKLGTIAQPRPAMFAGVDRDEQTFIGSVIPITGLTQTFNLARGINQTVTAAPSYFAFKSSDTDVALVNGNGVVTVVGEGTAEITATLNGIRARGSLTIESLGEFLQAPTPPVRNPANVISVFSDAYTNIPVDFYNGFFGFQTTLGGAITLNGQNIIQYTNLNFVATEFKNPTINISQMTHFHVDIFISEPITTGDFISIELGDFGPNNVFGGGDDSAKRIQFASTSLTRNQWISLDIPIADFALASRNNLAQIFFISDGTISTILVDNMYFYR
ncbi:MAG: Ig-like domain-containing protein [Chryseotalea sp.]